MKKNGWERFTVRFQDGTEIDFINTLEGMLTLISEKFIPEHGEAVEGYVINQRFWGEEMVRIF